MSVRRESLKLDESRRSFHCAVAVNALRKQPAMYGHWLQHTDGRSLAMDEVQQIVSECLDRGYEVVPPCDEIEPDGSCAGHAVVTCEEWESA